MSGDPETFPVKPGDRVARSRGEYGIVANVIEPDRQLRTGAKVWISGGTGGEGWHRFKWIGLQHGGGRPIEKWAPTVRFGNFRAAWVPDNLQGKVTYMRGTRPEMEVIAAGLNEFADHQRVAHPNRLIGPAPKASNES